MDWSLIIGIIGALIGIVGTIFGCWSFLWTRKIRILDGLSEIIRKYISGLRQLTDANNARRKADGLRLSFPNGGTNGEAAKTVNKLVDQYNDLINKAQQTCREVEIEVAANVFKFPDEIKKELLSAKDNLFKLSQLVNEGLQDAVDIQVGCVKDRYTTLVRVAKGWRLMNIFATIIKTITGASEEKGMEKIKKQVLDPRETYTIPEERMNIILALLNKSMTSHRQRSFAIHPPKQILDNPDLLEGEIDLDLLHNLMFKVAFQDGKTQALAFNELMFLEYGIVFAKSQMQDISEKFSKGEFSETTVEVKTTISPKNDIMQPATVKALLDKIEFSQVAAEAI